MKYKVVEITKEQTETRWGLAMTRSICYDTKAEAEEKMKTLEPIKNGTLAVVSQFGIFVYRV